MVTPVVDAGSDFLAETAGIPETVGDAVNSQPGSGDPTAPPLTTASIPGVTPETLGRMLVWPFRMIARAAGDGGQFWEMGSEEAAMLGEALYPALSDLYQKIVGDSAGVYGPALLALTISLGPRLALERSRRDAMTGSTATANAGDSVLSPAPPGAVNLSKPTA